MTGYSKEKLKKFKILLLQKLECSEIEYNSLQCSMEGNSRESNSVRSGSNKANTTFSVEEISQEICRLKIIIEVLSSALGRIESGNFGMCYKTGKLLQNKGLIAVPHPITSIDPNGKNVIKFSV